MISFLKKYSPVALLWLLYACQTGNPYDGPATIATGTSDHPIKSDGQAIFQQNCASCHHPIKDATGPALNRELIRKRSDDWIFTMLTNRKHLKKDKAYRALVKKYDGFTCSEFDLSRAQVQSLLYYLRNPVIGF